MDKSTVPLARPVQPVEFPAEPWDKVGVDMVCPFENATPDCCFALTLPDYYLKWPEVAFTSSANIITFPSSVFSRLGNLRILERP